MNYTVEVGKSFKREYKRLSKKYRSLEQDVDSLVESLIKNPFQGADLGGGVRKVRMAVSDKAHGKSGGARVITYTVNVDESTGCITLLTLYDKSEQDSIGKKDIERLLSELE